MWIVSRHHDPTRGDASARHLSTRKGIRSNCNGVGGNQTSHTPLKRISILVGGLTEEICDSQTQSSETQFGDECKRKLDGEEGSKRQDHRDTTRVSFVDDVREEDLCIQNRVHKIGKHEICRSTMLPCPTPGSTEHLPCSAKSVSQRTT